MTTNEPTMAVPRKLPEMAPSPHAAITMDAVSLQFAEGVGVQDLNLQVSPGTIFGLIGPSGSGKTTTIRLLTGIYKPQRGKIQVMSQDPFKFSAKTRERLGYMPQLFTLYPQLTVWENLNFVASLYGVPILRRGKRLNPLLDFVELSEARHRLGSRLSGGMQRRLALAAALVNTPDILFADEPTAGIDPVLRAKFWEYFRSLREQGRTIVVTTQYVGEAAYCDVVGVMRAGRLIHVDTPDNLRRQALGGQVIRLSVDAARRREALRLVDVLAEVKRAEYSKRDPGEMFIYTDDAATTIPLLLNSLNANSDLTVHAIEKYELPFDDIFVQLMEQDTNA